MSLADIVEFVRLEKDGIDTITKRRRMLERQRNKLIQHLAELQTCLEALDNKIAYYSDINQELLACVTPEVDQHNG